MDPAAALARLAAYGLPGAVSDPITVESPEAFVALAEQRRALSWVSQAVAAGMVANAGSELDQQLRTAHLGAVQTTMAAHAAAVNVLARLAGVGLCDVRVLKGCATAHLDYPKPTDRFSTDVDLLIPACDLDVLASAFEPGAIPEPRRRGWQERYGKSTTVVDANGVEIDLHVQISQGYFGLAVPMDELIADPVTFRVGDTEVLALDGPNRLLHAANHIGGSSHYNLNSARDVLQLALVSGIDWTDAVERAERWKVDALFALGVRRAWTDLTVEPHPLSQWADRHETVGRQRLAMRMVGDRPRGHLLTAPLALPPGRWPGYVGPMLFPSRAYLEENGKTWATRTKSLLGELRPW